MKEKSVEEGVAPLTLIKVIATHWNLHASCLLRLLDVQKVVNGICSEWDYGLRHFMFTMTEWEIMEQLEDILEVSKDHYALVFVY